MIRKATATDIPAVAAIYGRIHDKEEAGLGRTGWLRNIYPTEATARLAAKKGDLFVEDADGVVLAAGRINREQCPEYALCPWLYDAPPEQIMVLHTLVVDPVSAPKGTGTAFALFYEEYARSHRRAYNSRDVRSHCVHKKEVRGVLALSDLLGNSRRHRHGGNARRTDKGVYLSAREPVHNLCGDKSSAGGYAERDKSARDNK